MKPLYLFLLLLTPFTVLFGAEEQTLYDIPPDIMVPDISGGEPAAGKRVRCTAADWKDTAVYHTLYLPKDWKGTGKLPVIVEYAGNGDYKNGRDISTGKVEDCVLGFGLSEGKAIWVCLPFIEIKDGQKQNCITWWGDVDETKRYCVAAVNDVCKQFGGDASKVILAGFSRGAIACGFIGLNDDEIAALWSGFFCHSHFDGVRKWNYPASDRAAALVRLKRIGKSPVWVSQEKTVDDVKAYLQSTGFSVNAMPEVLPYPNHTAEWILRDIPLRRKAREWYKTVTD
ncbi:hypothetical protein FACS18942_10430 [Planctomycetales bacterium]|nr:hypothetical protein FACS18942_10430 [Planctomycetales bacterium]